MKTKSIRHNFTLVELLVVIIIITLIGGITIPLYKKLMTGNAVSYANRLINSQLNMARTHACKKRLNIAVLFADYGLNWKSSLEDADKLQFAQRAFRCAYVKKDASGDWVFDEENGWVEGSKWEFLPNGAFFSHPTVSGADENAVHDGDAADSNNKRGLYPINDAGYSVKDVTDDAEYFDKSNFKFAIIFQANGKPVEVNNSSVSSNSPRVRIVEGVVSDVDKDKGVTVVKHNRYNYMISQVNRYTGAVSTKAPEIE